MGLIKNIVDYSNDIVEEARRLENEGLNYKQAYRKALKEYADYCSDQSNSNLKDIVNSIAPGEDIDNGQVYSEETGETLRDLI